MTAAVVRAIAIRGAAFLAAFKVYEAITPHLFAIPVLLAAYALFLLAKPDKRCGRCSGWGARGRRRSACGRCKGTGRRFRLGAPLVHRGNAMVIRHIREWRESRS